MCLPHTSPSVEGSQRIKPAEVKKDNPNESEEIMLTKKTENPPNNGLETEGGKDSEVKHNKCPK